MNESMKFEIANSCCMFRTSCFFCGRGFTLDVVQVCCREGDSTADVCPECVRHGADAAKGLLPERAAEIRKQAAREIKRAAEIDRLGRIGSISFPHRRLFEQKLLAAYEDRFGGHFIIDDSGNAVAVDRNGKPLPVAWPL